MLMFECIRDDSDFLKKLDQEYNHKITLWHLSPRFKSFGSSLNSLNPALRPNLRPNSDDSLCHVIDSCEILGST